MKKEKSCGTIVFRKNNGVTEFLVINPKDRDYWEFPKGHVERGESEEDTALRETFEEVGLRVEIIPGFREAIEYPTAVGVWKTVVFFLGKFRGGEVRYVFGEVQAHEWLSFDKAVERVSFDNARSVLVKAGEFLKKSFK